MMRFFKLFLLTFLIHGCGCLGVYAQINGVDGKPSVEYNTNLIKNPSAAENTLYMDPELGTSGTLTRDTTSGNKIDGKASFLATPGDLNPLLDAFILIDLFPASDEQKSSLNRCSFSGLYKGEASAWEVVIRNGLDLVESKPLADVTEFTPFKLTVPCVSNPRISFFSAAGSNTKAFNYGLLTYGLEKGNPVPMAVRGTYTANISNAGVLSKITPTGSDWIQSCVVSGLDILCTLKGFTEELNCQLTQSSGTGNQTAPKVFNRGPVTLGISAITTTNALLPVAISCTKTGADDLGAGFYAGNLDENLRSVGIVTIGATTTAPTKGTSSTDRVLLAKIGKFAKLRYEFVQTGAGTAGSGDYLFTLPNGIKFDSSMVNYHTTGSGIVDSAAATKLMGATLNGGGTSAVGSVVPYNETQFRVHVIGGSTTNITRAYFGSAYLPLSSTSITLSIDFMAPIEGWTSSNGAYIENGIVTTGSKSKRPRIEWAIVGGSGNRDACISSTCTISKNSSDFISATRAGSGSYEVDVSGWGDVSKIDFCTAHNIQLTSGNGNVNIQNSPLSPSTYRVTTRQNSLTENMTDTAFGYTCYGQW